MCLCGKAIHSSGSRPVAQIMAPNGLKNGGLGDVLPPSAHLGGILNVLTASWKRLQAVLGAPRNESSPRRCKEMYGIPYLDDFMPAKCFGKPTPTHQSMLWPLARPHPLPMHWPCSSMCLQRQWCCARSGHEP